MSFLWALLPNQMMQWIITTTSLSAALPSCYWNILECHSVVVYCISLSSEVCLPLRFFTVPRVDLWNKLLEFAPWRTKNDRFSQIDCSLYKWLLNILYCNIITLEPILPQARFFFWFSFPFLRFHTFLYIFLIFFWIEDSRTDVFCMHFWQFVKSTCRRWTSFLYPKTSQYEKIHRGDNIPILPVACLSWACDRAVLRSGSQSLRSYFWHHAP